MIHKTICKDHVVSKELPIKLKGKVILQKMQLRKCAIVFSVAVLRMLLLLFSREQ